MAMARCQPGVVVGLMLLGLVCCLGPRAVQAQEAPAATPEGMSEDERGRLQRIEDQLQALSQRNLALQQQYDALTSQYQRLLQLVNQPQPPACPAYAPLPGEGPPEVDGPMLPPPREGYQSGLNTYAPPRSPEPRRDPLELMQNYVDQRGTYKPDMPPLPYPGTVFFEDGLQFRSSDGYFSLQFHNLTQFDVRLFDPTGDPLRDNMIVPRQRWYFQGDLSPYATYYTSINRGYGSLDVLDAWMDFNFFPQFKEEFQVRVGRMKTPFNYEYIKVSESDLIAPERSLFVGNFSGNREVGAMAHGALFDHLMEYALGVFDGPRRSFQSYDNSKDLYLWLNFKPFLNSGISWLEQINVGGGINGGNEHGPTQPSILTTANDQSNSAMVLNVSPTFLAFKNNVIEDGSRMSCSGDFAYYFHSFTVLANVEGGYQNYALNGPSPTSKETQLGTAAFAAVPGLNRRQVPLEGWSFAATYFLTGEEITRRVYLVEPIRPFGYYNGRFNPGAIEIYSRFSDLQVGSEVFSGGFANPAIWSNRANAIDTGVNWYLNHYVRFYLDWQHSMFGSPVQISPTSFTRHEDLFWFRTQVFF
jgi:phosphate-selective porin OprO/OprP